MQDLPENHFRVSGASWVNIIHSFIHSTAYDINVWERFYSSIGEVRQLENISAGSLNILLCKFFMNVKKKDG